MREADKSITATIRHIHRENWENRAGASIQNRGMVVLLQQVPADPRSETCKSNPHTGDGRRRGLAESI